jgi:hypothetical protein
VQLRQFKSKLQIRSKKQQRVKNNSFALTGRTSCYNCSTIESGTCGRCLPWTVAADLSNLFSPILCPVCVVCAEYMTLKTLAAPVFSCTTGFCKAPVDRTEQLLEPSTLTKFSLRMPGPSQRSELRMHLWAAYSLTTVTAFSLDFAKTCSITAHSS